MAVYDSAALLTMFYRQIRQPTNADFPTATDGYAYLTQGQLSTMADIVRRAPYAMKAAPVQLTTADGGFTYTFGTDSDGNNLYPVGDLGIFRQQTDIPDFPMVEGVDYLLEGDKIRFPNNRPFSGSTAPYWYGTVMSYQVSASSQPILKPVWARPLIVYEAARQCLEDLGEDTAAFADRYNRTMAQLMGVLQTQYAKQASIAATNPVAGPARARWWRWPRTY